ncbi:MAG: hypothetical protein MK212_05415 [Saprospiraceae bacterium]|nr:hypothetical protein [Saprospiraceae bacterium]
MKSLTFLFAILFLGIQFSQAQDKDNASYILRPTIVKIKFPEEVSAKRTKPISNKHQYYLDNMKENDISLVRDYENPAILYVKGRGSLNHVEIYRKDAAEGDYPIIDETFRGVEFQQINLSRLGDGEYMIKVISPHNISENFLALSTNVKE